MAAFIHVIVLYTISRRSPSGEPTGMVWSQGVTDHLLGGSYMLRRLIPFVTVMLCAVVASAHHGFGSFEVNKTVSFPERQAHAHRAGQPALMALLRMDRREREAAEVPLRDAFGTRAQAIGLDQGSVSGQLESQHHRVTGSRRPEFLLPPDDRVRERDPNGSLRSVREGAGRQGEGSRRARSRRATRSGRHDVRPASRIWLETGRPSRS